MVPLIVLVTPLKKCNLHALLKSSSWRLMLFLKKKKRRAAACTLFEAACRQRVGSFQSLRAYCMSGFIV